MSQNKMGEDFTIDGPDSRSEVDEALKEDNSNAVYTVRGYCNRVVNASIGTPEACIVLGKDKKPEAIACGSYDKGICAFAPDGKGSCDDAGDIPLIDLDDLLKKRGDELEQDKINPKYTLPESIVNHCKSSGIEISKVQDVMQSIVDSFLKEKWDVTQAQFTSDKEGITSVFTSDILDTMGKKELYHIFPNIGSHWEILAENAAEYVVSVTEKKFFEN